MASEPQIKWAGCEILKPHAGMSGAKMGLLNPGYLSRKVWPDINWGEAFAYLVRRFGFSGQHDWHKQLCSFNLTTPDNEVGFWLDPKPSDEDVEPGYWVAKTLVPNLATEDRRSYYDWPMAEPEKGETYSDRIPPEGTVSHRCHIAIEAGMRDLLRPVYIRDVPINILGRLSDAEASQFESAEHAWNEED